MKRSAFTIVEILIVLTVMGILLVIGFVSFDSVETSSRDKERTIDMETLAVHLEKFYTSGSDSTATIGQYPSVEASVGIIGNETTYLRDLDIKTVIAPAQTTSSLVASTNNNQTKAGVLPQPTFHQYVYQPIATDGSLCDSETTKECRKFNIFYRKESDNLIYKITSANQ